MPIDWDDIIAKAKTDTDEEFHGKISSLTSMTDKDIEKLLSETGIKPESFAAILKVLHDAAKSNKEKAAAIENISKGVSVLVSLAKKVI